MANDPGRPPPIASLRPGRRGWSAMQGAQNPAPRRWQRLTDRLQRLAHPRAEESLPVVLHRRRIYVLPTAFGLFYLLLMLVMGIGALNYNNNPALMLCLLLTGVGLASLLSTHLQLSGLQLSAVHAQPTHAGQALHLRVHVTADPRRPRQAMQIDLGKAAAILDLAGVADAEAVLELPTSHRGWYRLDRIRISTTRPLGFVRAWAWVRPDTRLLVYPAPEPQAPPLPVGSGNAGGARPHHNGAELHQLRNWRHGDSRRAVAWKQSARHGSLLVREYEEPVGQDIVLTWATATGLDHERRIERLARWIDEAEREQRRYRLELPGQAPIGPAAGPAHRHACLQALALMPEAG